GPPSSTSETNSWPRKWAKPTRKPWPICCISWNKAGPRRDADFRFSIPRQSRKFPRRTMIQPWQKIGSRPLGDFRIFTLRADRKISPRTGNEHEVFILDCADWVNVIAVTPDDQLVMVQQYRHGTNTVELEIPGGIVDREDGSPLVAGVR